MPTSSTIKNQKVEKYKGTIPLALTDGDIDEIGDKVQEIIVETWGRIDNHYKVLLE